VTMKTQGRSHGQRKLEPACLNIALVGGNSSGKALIKFLETHSLRHFHVRIVGVADLHADAPGLVYARNKGIYTTRDYKDFFALEDLHLLIEITGRDEVLEEIMRTKPKHVKVIDHLSARLFWDLIEVQEEKIGCERRLAHSSRLATVGRMASYLAHEIRNPLVSIGGFATTIQNSSELPEMLKPKAQIIIDEVRRLEAVLKSMRDFVRPLKQHKTRYNFNKLIQRAHSTLESEFKASGLEFVMDLDSEMPDCLFDVDLMLEALGTIIRRLMEFMEPPQRLSLKTEVCWDTIGIYIQGNGGWIPPDVLENMFNPFATQHRGDTGLDMAMGKKIIEDHGGEIRIISEKDTGTTVIIELPIEAAW
jgi:nitrogen-specific signal transduction histidine kinase